MGEFLFFAVSLLLLLWGIGGVLWFDRKISNNPDLKETTSQKFLSGPIVWVLLLLLVIHNFVCIKK